MATSPELTSRDRRRTLLAAGLGWTFDGYETYALILTLGAALPALLPAEDHARIPFFAGATIALTLRIRGGRDRRRRPRGPVRAAAHPAVDGMRTPRSPG